MKLEEIQELWAADSEIDRSELGNASLKLPKLHSKYFNIFSKERLLLRKLEEDLKYLKRLKYEYYDGTLDQETLKEYNWDPNPRKILRADLNQYIDSDKDIINDTLKIAYQKEKVEFLESCIRAINTRGFVIKNAIEWEKFKVGV